VRASYSALEKPKSERTKALFEEWKRLVSHAYPLSSEQPRRITEYYGFSREETKGIDGIKLFYAIQTYYALVLKLLAARALSRPRRRMPDRRNATRRFRARGCCWHGSVSDLYVLLARRDKAKYATRRAFPHRVLLSLLQRIQRSL